MSKKTNSLKPLIIIVLITTVIIAAGSYTLHIISSESQRLDERLSVLEKDISNQQWDEALNKLNDFHSKWDKTSTLWSMLIDHYEIDNIELVLSKLLSYVKTKDANQALSELSSLKALIKHIPNKEAFSVKNIL